MSECQAWGVRVEMPGGRRRWFVGFGRGGRLQTAWSLAGAYLFLTDTETRAEVMRIIGRIERKGYRAELRTVAIVE